MEAWHVVITAPLREVTVARELGLFEEIDAFCPARRVLTVLRGVRRCFIFALLPRIVFARWDGVDAVLWHRIRSTSGVTGILGGENPAPLSQRDQHIVESWLDRADLDWVVPGLEIVAPPLITGDLVRVSDPNGVYDGLFGRVLWFDAEKACLQGERSRIYAPIRLVSRVEVAAVSTQLAPTRGQRRRDQRRRGRLLRTSLERTTARGFLS
jgi:transcription antitermination factor NusG